MAKSSSCSRRTFLHTAGGLGAGAVLAGGAFGNQANERLVCAVIGVRGRGRSFYGPLATRKDTGLYQPHSTRGNSHGWRYSFVSIALA